MHERRLRRERVHPRADSRLPGLDDDIDDQHDDGNHDHAPIDHEQPSHHDHQHDGPAADHYEHDAASPGLRASRPDRLR